MNIYKTLVVLGFISIITACSSSDNDESLYVVTVSGAKHKLEGSYGSACFSTNGTDGEKHYNVIIRKEMFNLVEIYPGQPDCTGNTESSELTATLSVKSVAAISGWVDENDIPVAPPAADDGSTLGVTESTTLLHAVITDNTGLEFSAAIGSETDLFYIVDDTNGRVVLHRHWDAEDINNLKAVNSDQYPVLVKIY